MQHLKLPMHSVLGINILMDSMIDSLIDMNGLPLVRVKFMQPDNNLIDESFVDFLIAWPETFII